MRVRTLIVALTAIAVLAVAMPYAAVRTLHEYRLSAVDAELQRLAPAVSRRIHALSRYNVLLGPGRLPKAGDAQWHMGSSYPLESVLEGATVPVDPWGNAFVVNAGAAGSGAAIWLLSAGPDGTLQTPFDGSSAALGDDVGRRLR